MNLEEYCKVFAEKRDNVNNIRKAYETANTKYKKEIGELVEEYIKDNAKFKVGDVVRFAISPNGKKFIVKDVLAVTYSIDYPMNEFTKIVIRYHVETKDGWSPNGWWISEDNFVKVE